MIHCQFWAISKGQIVGKEILNMVVPIEDNSH